MEITKTFYAKDRAAWRKWLEKHCQTEKEIWLVFDRKAHNHKRLMYQEALDEVLCFGWIDGQVKGMTEKQYAQRFTPRSKKSSWSVANMKHYARLLKAGLVSEYGKKIFNQKHRIYDPKEESPFYGVRQAFQKIASPAKAKNLMRFFKTGKGEYAESDKFYGVTVPQTRKIAKAFVDKIAFARLQYLLQVGKHEERLCALLMLVEKFKKADPSANSGQAICKKCYELYLRNTKHINNWDLVDSSAAQIVGAYLNDKSKAVLGKLARSKSLWERRIAIIATFYYIQQKQFAETFKIADILLKDKEDLIHKAVGWMLREVGKKSGEPVLEKYLKPRYQKMPRTMLRYVIEHFNESKRQRYLKGQV